LNTLDLKRGSYLPLQIRVHASKIVAKINKMVYTLGCRTYVQDNCDDIGLVFEFLSTVAGY
jgi:hypothetical protein